MSEPGAESGLDGLVIRELVPGPLDGERVDRVVAMLTEVSRSEAADLVRSGVVQVDGTVVDRRADRLVAGVEITIALAQTTDSTELAPDSAVMVPVVFADDSVLVIDKPAGLVVHPGAGHHDATMVHGLLAAYPGLAGVGDPARPGIVHRLDRGTSGLLVVARTPQAHEALVAQLSARQVVRRYRALVWGHPEAPRGVVDAPIGRSPKHPTKMAVTERGKEARTRYEVVASFDEPVEISEVICHLETGRTHQIRVHMAAIGHAVVGDDRYNGTRQTLQTTRPYLHAEHLAFDHPETGEKMQFDSNLPNDLQQVRTRLQ